MELVDIAVVVALLGVALLSLKSLSRNRNKDDEDK